MRELAVRIRAQECLHEFIRLVRATGLRQRAHQSQLRRLQVGIELERPA